MRIHYYSILIINYIMDMACSLVAKVTITTFAHSFDFIAIGSTLEHKNHRSNIQSKGANIITVEFFCSGK